VEDNENIMLELISNLEILNTLQNDKKNEVTHLKNLQKSKQTEISNLDLDNINKKILNLNIDISQINNLDFTINKLNNDIKDILNNLVTI